MTMSLISAANWPIVGQICWVLGKVMNFIYTMLDNILTTDTGLVGWSIIIYTILVYTCMLPMTINQQRTTKMQAVINPEVQAIQKKYKNKKDQASMMKQQEEIQQVYDKYGTSMMGGCLPLLIQMPFLFALYPVIYNIQEYVPHITDEANKFLTIPNMTITPSAMISAVRSGENLGFPSAVIIITAILLPVLSGATQYISVKLSQNISGSAQQMDNQMAGTMKTMNITMPLFSVFMVFSLPTGIGVYWVVSAVVRCVQQIVINKYLSKMSIEDLIEKNKEKAARKREKRGERAEKINEMAQMNTKSIKSSANKSTSSLTEKEKEERIARASQNAKEGSLAAKANMVKKFNENK